MVAWPDRFTAVVVVTEPDRVFDLGPIACRHHFTVGTRSGQVRHLILAEAELADVTRWLESTELRASLMGRYGPMESELPEPLEGEGSKGLLAGFTDCENAEQYQAFNEWYDHTHAADVLASGFYWSARRFRLEAGEAPEFLACYETCRPGAEALGELMAHYEANPSPVDPICLVRHVWPFDRSEQQSIME